MALLVARLVAGAVDRRVPSREAVTAWVHDSASVGAVLGGVAGFVGGGSIASCVQDPETQRRLHGRPEAREKLRGALEAGMCYGGYGVVGAAVGSVTGAVTSVTFPVWLPLAFVVAASCVLGR